jgi:hypothetical protein
MFVKARVLATDNIKYTSCPFAVNYGFVMFYSTGPNVIKKFTSVIYK